MGKNVVLRSSVGDTKMVVTSAPETRSRRSKSKPKPCVSNKKLAPGAVCGLTEPEVGPRQGVEDPDGH